jgi:hypothetical protein
MRHFFEIPKISLTIRNFRTFREMITTFLEIRRAKFRIHPNRRKYSTVFCLLKSTRTVLYVLMIPRNGKYPIADSWKC